MWGKRRLPSPAPGPLTVRSGGSWWAVYDRTDARVSQQRSDKAMAEVDRDRLLAETAVRPRACLCCGAEFASEGGHNRLCDRCRKLDAGPVPTGWARRGRPGRGARA